MINLQEAIPFAEGGNRVCYTNPEDKSMCLKISKLDVIRSIRANAPWYKKLRPTKSFDDNFREEIAYKQRAIKKNPKKIWNHLARWYGFVETTKGLASCTELITNNGKVAFNLEEYLFSEGKTQEINKALREFETFLRDTKLLTKNIIPHNLAVKETEHGLKLKIIDGLGCMSFIPLPEISNAFAKRYVNKRIQLMNSRIEWDLSGRTGDWK